MVSTVCPYHLLWLGPALHTQDCPEDDEMLVTRPKPTATICSICFYVQRGSFNAKQNELTAKMEEHSLVKEKLLGSWFSDGSALDGLLSKVFGLGLLQKDSQGLLLLDISRDPSRR